MSKIKNWLVEIQPTLKDYAVVDYNENAFIKSALLAIDENNDLSKLVETPAGKKSLFNALRMAATNGLDLNPQSGKACIITYNSKRGQVVNYQIMKNGLVDLALRSGQVEFITTDTVFVNDTFFIKKTMDGDNYDHTIALSNRGIPCGYYAACKLKSGSKHVVYMSKEQVIDWKEKYSKSPNGDAWTNSFDQMAEKTVIKRLLNKLAVGSDVEKVDSAIEDLQIESEPKGSSPEDVKKKLQDKKKTDNKTIETTATVEPLPENKEGELFD